VERGCGQNVTMGGRGEPTHVREIVGESKYFQPAEKLRKKKTTQGSVAGHRDIVTHRPFNKGVKIKSCRGENRGHAI